MGGDCGSHDFSSRWNALLKLFPPSPWEKVKTTYGHQRIPLLHLFPAYMGRNRFIGSRNHLFSSWSCCVRLPVCAAAQAIGHTLPWPKLRIIKQNWKGLEKLNVIFRLFKMKTQTLYTKIFLFSCSFTRLKFLVDSPIVSFLLVLLLLFFLLLVKGWKQIRISTRKKNLESKKVLFENKKKRAVFSGRYQSADAGWPQTPAAQHSRIGRIGKERATRDYFSDWVRW